MTQKDNILQELKELNSSLAGRHQNVYSVPDGYFEGLIAEVISRIKAMEAANAVEELGHLSPVLSAMSKEMPYSVPSNYFEGLAENAMAVTKSKDDLSAKEELETLSPLLCGLKKDLPYTVPQGYFENLTGRIIAEESKPVSRTKVISLTHRKWFRYAAAAVVAGLLIMAGLFYFDSKKLSGGRTLAKFTRDVKKMDETQKENLIDFIDAGMTGDETVQVNPGSKTDEIKDLLKGVSEEELKDFQEQTEDLEGVLITD